MYVPGAFTKFCPEQFGRAYSSRHYKLLPSRHATTCSCGLKVDYHPDFSDSQPETRLRIILCPVSGLQGKTRNCLMERRKTSQMLLAGTTLENTAPGMADR